MNIQQLQKQAEQEIQRVQSPQYAGVIKTLREKGLSFREISTWFATHGVKLHYMQAYRIFRGRH